jgi:hypothetical protein
LLLIISLFAALLALALPTVLAQVAVTPEVESSEVLQPVNTPVMLPTSADAPVPEATAAPLSPFANDVLAILVPSRSDLEILAGQLMAGARPQGWSGNLDVTDPQLAVLIRLDLDLLMATVNGLENIPSGWFGAIPSTPYAIARDIRHDLELLADATVGLNVRPPGWSGAARHFGRAEPLGQRRAGPKSRAKLLESDDRCRGCVLSCRSAAVQCRGPKHEGKGFERTGGGRQLFS